ncbi:PriCT-2 domain-containing protein [Microbulbifer sp. THAF38]|uniref:PriCT-2 domain-containing protein n=1 Tax=Microbulbifer sp. THAF38 TaxID=2587856 RepID=UPI0012A882EA|nr:PriCT-2 domain-containing protein [Microbulbifer sp. THAF38]QFT53525.1 DNA primase TraC [Microbulbifer sp. THAF38]
MYEQCTMDDVRRALTFVLDYAVRDTWVEIGMAIKAEFGDSAFDIWDEWSQQADNYCPRSAKSTWKSFKRSAGGVGIGSLFAKAKEGGYKFESRELTPGEKAAWAKEKAAREKQRAEEVRREEAEIAAWHEVVRQQAQGIWSELKPTGRSKYLGSKKIGSHGVRFFRSALLLIERKGHLERVEGQEKISRFFALPKEGRPKFHYFKSGYFAIPMTDIDGVIWNLQIITPTGKKLFLRNGRKSGLYALLGQMDSRKPLILVEGFSTGASAHEATNCPVLICFDCGNLMPVALLVRQRFPDQHLVFAADNDLHLEVNDGVEKANAAARAVGGSSVWIPSLREEMEEVAA